MIKKLLLSILGIIALLIILMFIWLIFIFNPNDYKAWINSKINNDSNIHIMLNGVLDFSLKSMQLNAKEVTINAQNGTFTSHWQNATIKINPLDFFIHPSNPFESLTLQNGDISAAHQQFKAPLLNIVEKHQRYSVSTELTNDVKQLNIQLTLTPHPNSTEITDLSIQTTLNNLPVCLKVPSIYLSNNSVLNNIDNIRLKINDQLLIGNMSQIILKPKLSFKGQFTAPHLALAQIINLNGFKVDLDSFALDFAFSHNDSAAKADISINAQSANLIGIDLNAIASSTHNLLSAIDQGNGIGSAFQTLKSQLLPLLTKDKLIADPNKSTQLKKLSIQSNVDNNQLKTTSINWQAPEFTVTGYGQANLSTHELNYPLSIHIKGTPSLIIPYNLSYQNKQFTAEINQAQLQKNLQPIIEKALTNALNNKLGSFFR
ncbi:hypothetical protein [Cysteiniphilum sp. JM-1]|uniref:hypothetical protein n=1 Tax=Cysteiniphilum sp. JM-1 TaxID=2610891 RepID=UPI001244D09C|nr:hypothetical protein [Cysteiniphilum sp. JM-1]